MDSDLLEVLFTGVSVGSIYALIALGFSFLFATRRTMNIAHGDWATFAGMAAAATVAAFGLWAGIVLAPVLGALISVATYFFVLRRSRSSDVLTVALLLLGLGMVLQGLALWRWGPDPLGIPGVAALEPLRIGSAVITQGSVIVLVTGAALLGAVTSILRMTRIGRAMTAWAENPEAAALSGIDVHRVTLLAFGLAGVLAGVAGLLNVALIGLSYQSGFVLTIKAFGASALGGFNSPARAVAGAEILGLVEAVFATYVGGANSQVASLVTVLLLLVVASRRYSTGAAAAEEFDVVTDAANL